jgi:hypothetical protein
VGTEAPEVNNKHTDGLPITDSTVVSVTVPRTLTQYLEKAAIPKSLVRPFHNKTSRRQGSGYSDTVTVTGVREVSDFLHTLYEHRSASGWYVLATRVITDTEEQIARQARSKKGKR